MQALAQTTLQDLTGRASYGNMKSLLQPLFSLVWGEGDPMRLPANTSSLDRYFDDHECWEVADFAEKIFNCIMRSLQVGKRGGISAAPSLHLSISQPL